MVSYYETDLMRLLGGGQQGPFIPPMLPLFGRLGGPAPQYGGGNIGGRPAVPQSNFGIPMPSIDWGNIPWGQIAQIGGGLAQGYGAVQGANAQNAAAAANYAAQQAHAQRIMALIGPLMQQGQNPYANTYLSMLSGLTRGSSGGSPQPPSGPTDTGPGGGIPWGPSLPQFSAQGLSPSFTSMFENNPPTGRRPKAGPGGPGSGTPSSMIGPNGLVDPRGSRLASPFTYNPALASQQAPMSAFTQQLMQGFTPERVAAPGAITAERITAPGPVSTQQFNGGQDGLLQMMRRNIMPDRDAGLDANLNRQASGMERFDNSDLFAALEPLDQRNIDRQVEQLRAGAGSLGARFGTAMNRNEAMLRENALQDVALRNAQLQRDAYETAQGRSMQALGLQVPYQQSREQLPFQNAAMQLEAARAAGGLGIQGNQLDLQAQLANAENQLRAAQLNQGAGLQAGQFNAQTALQAALANQQAGLTAGLQGQQLQQTQLAQNQQAQNQTQLSQAQLIQNILLANQQAQNRAGEFNANAGMQQTAFNTGLDQQANQLILSLLGGAQGAQAQQLNQNTGLIGLLAGVGVPQQAPVQNPWGDMGQIAMLLPYLMQNRG